MTTHNRYQTNRPTYARVNQQPYYGKKKNSWISLIIHIIILILVGITCYSMYKQPILNFVLANQAIDFSEIKNFQNTTTQIGPLNINISEVANLHGVINKFILAFDVFFVLCIISMIISILTIAFNRTILKITNFIVITIALIITFSFSYTIQMLGKQISQNLNHFFLNLEPNQIITEADAIHNALILLLSSLALLFISFFFRSRYTRIN
ncbi:uncharacterized protein (DUF983 family) [Staphylococcus hominis]